MLTSNQIIKGDCLQVLQMLPSESVDLVVTDLPYFVRYRDRLGRTIANDSDPASVMGAFDDVYRVLRSNTYCVSFTAGIRFPRFSTLGPTQGFVLSSTSSGTRATHHARAF
jgi:site-specific DNA-methyltransferase (adenine-specific)